MPNPKPADDANVRGVGTHVEGGGKGNPDQSPDTGGMAMDTSKLKAMGYPDEVSGQLSAQEAELISSKALDFAKLIKFVAGLIKLITDTFGPTSPTDPGVFGAQKAPDPEVSKLKAAGVPDDVARFGFGNLVAIIKMVLSLFGGGGIFGAQSFGGSAQSLPANTAGTPGPKSGR